MSTDPNPDSVSFWKPGFLRLFVSHRDSHKAAAKQLADALEEFGLSAFVAHDTIEPMSTWQREILKGLETMEAMLIFLTDDFHESVWTNQEVGYALGRGTPIISLKLEGTSPMGFIGSEQALRGTLSDPVASVDDILDILSSKLGQERRLRETLISAFLHSSDYSQSIARFDRMTKVVSQLSDDEFRRIQDAFESNNQLHGCYYLTNRSQRLQHFLHRATGKNLSIDGKRIVLPSPPGDDEIPF